MHHTHLFRPASQRGLVLALLVHALLLVVVLAQIVFLASRHRVRIDLTSDKMSSTTDSTKTVLGKLEKRLLIEAYFSPKDKLPVTMRETRVVLDNFLDELVQLGNGRVIVQRFDPNADKAIADRCSRIGVQPLDLQSSSSTALSVERHWQGLRLRYGGDRSKVLAQFQPPHPFYAEAALTPAIKEVTTEQKRRIGYMEWPAQAVGQQQPGGIGWNVLRTVDQIAKRFEFQNYKDEDGVLLPADVETLFLYRPKDLTDRQKYVLDQFLMRGGTLVVFADAVEYAIGPQRQFTRMPFLLDATGSQKKFTEQLWSYGIDWRPKLVADLTPEVQTPRDLREQAEYYAVPRQTPLGAQYVPVQYPYFFHPRAYDWSADAERFSKGADGKADETKADAFRKQFVAGSPTDEFLFRVFKQIGRGPGFYWPTWVGLREKAGGVPDLPPGVTGSVLLWSSPGTLVEEPPQVVDPLGRGDPQTQTANLRKFQQKFSERFFSEPRQQAPLMVDVRGTFSSFFAGAERPKRPSEIKEEEARKAEANKTEPPKEGEQPPQDPEVGPPKPDDQQTPKPPPEADMLAQSAKPGRIVMIGDADFIRDDLLRGDYRQAGGPRSMLGGQFFLQLLDWLAEDQDLVELQSRTPTDRTLKFIDREAVAQADARLAEQALRRKTQWLIGLNVVLPAGLLGLFGITIALIRRAQKRAFFASLR